MKFLIVFVALFAVAMAVEEVHNLRFESDVLPDGYKFGFENSDGNKHESSGHLTNAGTDKEALEVEGTFSYVGDDGKTYTVKYTAGEGGFEAHGDHLPVPQH